MYAVYWLGAPGVSQLEYPPGSGTFYNLGDLIPGMSEPEAQALVPLGHSFEIPSVFPYGTPYQEPALRTSRRLSGPALRTGEPESASPGMIVGGAAPQALWAHQPEHQPEPLVAQIEPGAILGSAAPQSAWSTTSSSGATITMTTTTEPEAATEAQDAQVVAVAVRDPAYQPPAAPVTAELGTEPEPEVVAVATPDPNAPPEPEPEPEPEGEPETLEELPDFESAPASEEALVEESSSEESETPPAW